MCIVFLWICFREIWILSIFGAHLFSRMAFKRKFRVYLILRNQPKFEKFTKIFTRKISTLKVDKNRKLSFKLPYLHFKRLVSFRLYLHLFCSIFPGSKILTFVFVMQRDFLEPACICNICSNLFDLFEYKKNGHIKLLKSMSCVMSIAFYSCREKHSLEMNMLEMNIVCWRLKKKTIRH